MARILVIDDDDQVRDFFREMLEHVGYEVVEASDGNAGIARFTEDPTDLVITDIMMPGKDGLETIEELRRSFPDVKIIAITGEGIHSLPVAYDLGAVRIFEKPIVVNEIREAVRELLNE